MPGIKITDEDRLRIDPRFICTLCRLLLYFPMQTMCGHSMCMSCIESLLGSSDPKCPEDGEELSKEKVFPDVFIKRELSGLRLHCANPGCSWQSTYDQLEGHSQVCGHAFIKCVHSQCKLKFQRSRLDEHLKMHCEYRNVKCKYCQKDIVFSSIKEHVGSSCEGAPETCKHCGEKVLRKDIKRHEKELCTEAPVTCDFQPVGCNHDKTLKLRELRGHMEEGLKNHTWLLLQYVLAFVTQLKSYIPRPEFAEVMQKIRKDITDVRSGLAEKFIMLVGKLTGLERRIETLESSGGGDTSLTKEVSEMKIKVRDLTERNMSLEREFRDKMSDIQRSQSRMEQSLALHTDIGSQRDDSHFFSQRTNCVQRREFTEITALGRQIETSDARPTALQGQIETSDARRTNDVNELNRRVRDLDAKCSNLQRELQNVMLITGSRPQCMEDVVLEIDSPFRYNSHSYNGTLLWKIEGYQRKRQDAINGVRTALYSPPFYSARYGYKMCAKIYMNGDGFGQGSHLSLFLVVMRGDFDALQTWPFQKRITFMLLDQGNGDHMIDAFHSDPHNSSFQRPQSEMNIASGFPLFMPFVSLHNHQYVRDDVIFIVVIVN